MDLLNFYFDIILGNMVMLYYMPYFIPQQMDTAEAWASMVSLNGIKSSNLCKPY